MVAVGQVTSVGADLPHRSADHQPIAARRALTR